MKNLPIGEGGSILTNNIEYYDWLYSYHNFGYTSGSVSGQINSITTLLLANKIRMAEYQAVLDCVRWKNSKNSTKY